MSDRHRWPCGCVTWRDGAEFKLDWCRDEGCPVYREVIRQSLGRGNQVVFRDKGTEGGES